MTQLSDGTASGKLAWAAADAEAAADVVAASLVSAQQKGADAQGARGAHACLLMNYHAALITRDCGREPLQHASAPQRLRRL